MAGILLPNSFQTPNAYIDDLLALLSPEEFKVLIYAARRIFGFNRHADHISLAQFCEGTRGADGRHLDYGTGMNIKTVRAALATLCGFGVLLRQGEGGGAEAAMYELQLDADAINWAGLEARRRGAIEANQRLARARFSGKGVLAAVGGPCDGTPTTTREGDPYHDKGPPLSTKKPSRETQLGSKTCAVASLGINENPTPAKEKPPTPDVELHWPRFRQAYPPRQGSLEIAKGKAKFESLLKTGTDPEVLISGAQRYAEFVTATGAVGGPYVKNILTWLNGKGWEEEYDVWSSPPALNGRGGQQEIPLDVIVQRRAEAAIQWRDEHGKQ